MASKTLAVMVVLALLAGILLTVYAPALSLQNTSPNQSGIGCNRSPGYLLIIADQNGFNDSVHHKRPWPIIQVQKGTSVGIIVCNEDSVEAHGFGIDKYFDPTQLRPGQFARTTFVADQPGNYTIYCSIFCSVHVYMQGRFVVSP